MRFSLSILFRIVLIVSVIGTVFCLARGVRFRQLHRANRVIAEFPQVAEFWLMTNDDVEIEVEHIWISTHSHPEIAYEIAGTDGISTSELRARIKNALIEQRPTRRPAYYTHHTKL